MGTKTWMGKSISLACCKSLYRVDVITLQPDGLNGSIFVDFLQHILNPMVLLERATTPWSARPWLWPWLWKRLRRPDCIVHLPAPRQRGAGFCIHRKEDAHPMCVLRPSANQGEASEGPQALRLLIENRRHARRFSCDFVRNRFLTRTNGRENGLPFDQ